jgi:adenosylcobinamide-phosphate synthase
VHVALLWFALGAKSLRDHIAPIARALGRGDLPEARVLTAKVVSRDTENADEAALSRAAVESALENGNDAIFGALFWFVIAGGPGALMFRLANTLDAMWGYRTPRYLRFGWAAARFDDVLNFVPARLTAASYALLGDTRTAWRCWRTQAPLWDSPNAGPVMASGAGSLNVMLGGAAIYHGTLESRPVLGFGKTAAPRHVVAAMRLVDRTILLWLVVLLACAFLGGGPHG